ncbi:MAG: 30S ribosomal protein S15 [Nanoarchaeota archaeon]|nr:30S ribosomal protein S15 [Nanoarchaeota archaeon]MBU4241946.1 30S ribosomal protein S15 [Nanoarchaeota archaeon]MBU4352364.1 30S ribosomal protein S15 [Nanoarchaeota archaeon]MBU4455871.1 30S ribosomal protein S15 [Nanoarchaeota archaeon]MCG2719492.1 30S ribosomal protein S15 [Nanoarchaeota archaeon]
MARMYSRKRGKAGSTKPVKKTTPTWVSHKSKVVEQLILKLAKSEKTTSEIGIILRDTYGIPSVRAVTGKKINQILIENKAEPALPENLRALIVRHINLMKHMESNNHDKTAKRGAELTESKINRLVKYYRRTSKLPANWKYDKAKAKLLVA